MGVVLENMKDLYKYRTDDESVLLKNQFGNLEMKLRLLHNPLNLTPEQWRSFKEMRDFNVLVKEDLYLVLLGDNMKGNFSKENRCLSDFMRKVELVKGKIQQVYDQIRDSLSYDFPKTGLGFSDFLLQNLGFLKEKLRRDTLFIPFAKHRIIKIEEELMSLRPYLNDLFEQQKELTEVNDTWSEVINLACLAEYAINSCLVIGHPLWHNMARRMGVLNEIKVVKIKHKKIDGRNTHDGGVLYCSAIALDKVSEDPWASCFNQVIVGLEAEINIKVGKLIHGSRFLDIVAIVGMDGLGKTTLASKVDNALVVRNHFHMFAYCIVSQVHNARKILLDYHGEG